MLKADRNLPFLSAFLWDVQSDGAWKYPGHTAVLYRRFKVGGQYPARQFEHALRTSYKKADRNGKFLSAFSIFYDISIKPRSIFYIISFSQNNFYISFP